MNEAKEKAAEQLAGYPNTPALDKLLKGAQAVSGHDISRTRVKVLVLGAKIDNIILKRLQEYLVMSVSSADDDLLGDGRPLGTFRLRIKLAHRLGLISPTMLASIKNLGEIRNLCAHREEDIDIFTLDKVKSYIDNIWGRLHPQIKQGKSRSYEQKFELIGDIILFYLKFDTSRQEPLKAKQEEIIFNN